MGHEMNIYIYITYSILKGNLISASLYLHNTVSEKKATKGNIHQNPSTKNSCKTDPGPNRGTKPGPMAANISTKSRASSRSPRATSFSTTSLPRPKMFDSVGLWGCYGLLMFGVWVTLTVALYMIFI